MESRPRIKIELSPFDKFLERSGVIILVVTWAFALFVTTNAPEIIPVHFDMSGKPDRYGNKLTLLLLPAIATPLYLGLAWLSKRPHLLNYLTPITAENARKQYTMAARLLRFLKFAVSLTFLLIILFTFLVIENRAMGLGNWLLPLIIGLFLIPTLATIILSLKK